MSAPLTNASIASDANRKDASTVFTSLYVLAYYGIWMTVLTPPTLSLALRVAQIAPTGKEALLSTVLGLGAVVAMIANPLWGYLSDRTTSRFGMRRPWILGGMVVGLIGLYAMGTGGRVTLILGWCLTQGSLNATLAAITAVLPDQIPESRRGAVSGFLGIAPLVGSLGGAFLATLVGESPLALFTAPWALTFVLVVIFSIVLKDRRLAANSSNGRVSLRDFLRGFAISPTKTPDFFWAFLSRFLLFIGLATLLSYQVYFLSDRLRIVTSAIPQAMFKSLIVMTIAAVLGGIISGRLSDWLRRRKIFVLGAAVVYALGLLLVGLAHDFNAFLLGIGIAGLGQGIYFAVDLALITDVLPDRDTNAGRDLGIFLLANSLPQMIAPSIAPIFLAIGAVNGASNYTALFTAAATFALLGALAIVPVRTTR